MATCSKMSPRERFFANLQGKETDRPSVINPTSIATIETCSVLGVNFSEVHLNADKMCAVAAYGYEHLGFDSVMPYFSVLQEAAALGAVIDWGTGNAMPAQRSALFDDPSQFKFSENFLDRLPAKTVIDSIKLLRARLGNDALIIGKVMGPWTLSYHLYGVENFLIDTVAEPEKARAFLEAFKPVTMAFAAAQFAAGADMVTLADHATADLVSPSAYAGFLLPLHQEIVKYFGGGKLILHCCGNTLDRIHLFAKAGFGLFHFDSKNDIVASMAAAGSMKLTGCVNNPEILLNGTPADVECQVKTIAAAGIRFIAPECAVPLNVKNINLAAIARAVDSVDLQP